MHKTLFIALLALALCAPLTVRADDDEEESVGTVIGIGTCNFS